MKIYFGAVKEGDLFDTTCMFASPDNDEHYFYYGVEYGTNPGGLEEVTIFDGVDRHIPIDMESIPALIRVLSNCHKAYQSMQLSERIVEYICDPKSEESVIYG